MTGADPDRDTPLRWGVVGTGGVSDYFISDLHLAKSADVVAIASRDRARATRYAAERRVPVGYEFSALLDDDTVDVVYIATPSATHYALAMASLDAGKHVVVEKPVALRPAEARDLIARSLQTGRFFTEAMWMKFNPVFRQVRDLISEGAIGEVRSVRASFGLPFPRGVGSRWNASLGGSSLFDQGIYAVTLATTILGSPISSAIEGAILDGVDVTHRVDLTFDAQRFAQIAGSMVEFIDPSAAISGTDGWITIDAPFWTSRALTLHRGDIATALMSPQRRELQLEGFGYMPMIESIASDIRDGRLEQVEHSHADILATVTRLAGLHAGLLEQAAQNS